MGRKTAHLLEQLCFGAQGPQAGGTPAEKTLPPPEAKCGREAMRAKGMINVQAIDVARRQLAVAGANLVAEMSQFMPAQWPTHRFSEETPDGVFEESTILRSAPHFPGKEVRVPDWQDLGTAYDFDEAESVKVADFSSWLFSRKSPEWCADYFGFDPRLVDVFEPFERRADRRFEGGKFPRDQWKAGSFDADAWNAARQAIGASAAIILQDLDSWNSDNVVLVTRDWLVTKFVQGELVPPPGVDTTFALIPEVLADVEPDWHDYPAYLRVGLFVADTDPTWTAAGLSFAATVGKYDLLFSRLTSGAFAKDYFDQCVTVWRNGSQTLRRDQYE